MSCWIDEWTTARRKVAIKYPRMLHDFLWTSAFGDLSQCVVNNNCAKTFLLQKENCGQRGTVCGDRR